MKHIPFYMLLMLLLISKTIEEPIFLNMSPADVLWPLAGLMFAWRFLGRPDFRKRIKENNAWLTVIVLFFWGLGVSVLNFKFNSPNDMSSQDFLSSLIVNNLKSLLIIGYYTLGLWTSVCVRHKGFQTIAWGSTLVFSVVGLKAYFTGTPEWAMGGRRIISMVNDPNVAAWVCLLGLLFVWSLVFGTASRVKWQNRLLKGLPLLSVPVFILTLLLTGSRTGLAGLGLLAFMLLLSMMYTGRRALLLLSVVFFLGAGLIHFDHELLEGKVYAHISSRIFNGTESASDFRGLLREAAMDMGMDHPIIGVGPGQFPFFSTPYYEALGEDITTKHFKTTVAPKVPHNTYATFFAERGVIGVGLFILLISLGLRNARSGPEYGFMGLIILYSMFFNIENIRFVWFFWGGLALLRPYITVIQDEAPTDHNTRPLAMLLVVVLISSVLIFISTVGQLYRTGIELTGQTLEVIVTDGGLDMTLQMSGSRNDPLFLRFDGPEVREIIIRNAYNFYHDHYELVPGKYELTLNSGAKTRKLNHMRLQSGEMDMYVHGRLLQQWGLGVQRMDDVYASLFSMNIIRTNAFYEDVEYEGISTKFIHKSTGINFENQISLVSSNLTSLEENGQYRMTWTFEKTGTIENPYMLLGRAYDLRDSRRGHAKNLAQNIVFDPPLTELEIGETFTASWIFNTEDRPYMIQYSFYYRDKEAEQTYQLYPKWVQQGYVQ